MEQQETSNKEDSFLSPGQMKRLNELRKRAEAAFSKNNYYWASELYGEIYSMDRAHLAEYLQKMIFSALGNKSLNSASLWIFHLRAFFSNVPHYLKVLRTKESEKTQIVQIFDALESIIRNDPDSLFALNRLCRVYEKNELMENAAIVLESILRKTKNKLPILRRMGNLYLSIGNIEKAREVFKKILDIKPFDQEAEKKMRDILALTSIDEASVRGPDYTNSIKDKKVSQKVQIEMKANKTREEILYLIQEKKHEIEGNPLSIPLKYQLLSYYRELDDKKSILETLNDIANISKGDLNILMEKLEADISYQEEQLKKDNNNPDFVLKKLNQYKKESIAALVAQFPSSIELKFRLAKVLMELEENDAAIKLFQVCSKMQEFCAESLNNMGILFLRKNMYDLAEDQFKKGISELNEMNTLKKELMYHLGSAYELNGNVDSAIEQYKLIYKEDVSFMDVSQKIEKFYQKKQ